MRVLSSRDSRLELFSARGAAAVAIAALVVSVTLLASAGGALPAQRKKALVPRVDPYTHGDPDAMARAGYVALAPFEFADGHDTRHIEEILGGIGLIWVETAHFKIGSSLPALRVSDKKLHDKLRPELKRLAEKLPGVRARHKALDPWLRLHLFAQRLEDLYADFSRRLGVDDDSFPRDDEEARRMKPYMGKGRYLGMRSKFTVMLFKQRSSMGRFLRRFANLTNDYPMRAHFRKSGSLYYGVATECSRGRLVDDTGLHCNVAHSVVHNMIDGYRGFSHDLPPWFRCGLSLWYTRRIDPRWNNFDQMKDGGADLRAVWDWQPRMWGAAKHGTFTPLARLMVRLDYDGWKFADYMQAWSRVDHLISLGDDGFRTFVNVMSDPFHDGYELPTPEELLARQAAALEDAWGKKPAALDGAWRDWVQATYRRKLRAGH